MENNELNPITMLPEEDSSAKLLGEGLKLSNKTESIPQTSSDLLREGLQLSTNKGIESTISSSKFPGINLEEYQDYFPEGQVFPRTNLQKERAIRQSGTEQFGRTVGNTLWNIPLG